MEGIAFVLSNTPKAIAKRFCSIYCGIQMTTKANKLKNSFVVPKYEIPEWISCNENYRATNQ